MAAVVIDRKRVAVPSLTDPEEGSHVLRNPASPALLTWFLLVSAYAIQGEFSGPLPILLACAGLLFGVLFILARPVSVPLPQVPERDVALLVCASLTALTIEATYFGLPILGGVAYNEFGFPIVHHITATIWIAPLLAPRHNRVYLGLALAVGAVLLNRQLMLLALIGYLMRRGIRGVILPVILMLSLVALGSIRNQMLSVEAAVDANDQLLGGALSELLFWTYLYVLGPYHATFGVLPSRSPIDIEAHWNTVPEWAVFSSLGFPLGISLIAFYLILAATVVLLTRLRVYEARIFGLLLHVLAFVTFFSSTILSTPIIGSWLIIVFLRRAQQLGKPN